MTRVLLLLLLLLLLLFQYFELNSSSNCAEYCSRELQYKRCSIRRSHRSSPRNGGFVSVIRGVNFRDVICARRHS